MIIIKIKQNKQEDIIFELYPDNQKLIIKNIENKRYGLDKWLRE